MFTLDTNIYIELVYYLHDRKRVTKLTMSFPPRLRLIENTNINCRLIIVKTKIVKRTSSAFSWHISSSKAHCFFNSKAWSLNRLPFISHGLSVCWFIDVRQKNPGYAYLKRITTGCIYRWEFDVGKHMTDNPFTDPVSRSKVATTACFMPMNVPGSPAQSHHSLCHSNRESNSKSTLSKLPTFSIGWVLYSRGYIPPHR